MIQLLWIVLPIAAARRWWKRRRRAYRGGVDPDRRARDLLGATGEKALNTFLERLEGDPEVAEVALSLGTLFRTRGEVERAIRIHQHLVERTELGEALRLEAEFELAKDFMKAGLLDRAEGFLLHLLQNRGQGERAIFHLVELYQRERDWQSAIAMLQEHRWLIGNRLDNVLAHFYCELAEQHDASGDAEQAHRFASRALLADRHCMRARMLLGRLALRTGSGEQALQQLRSVAEREPELLPEMLYDLEAAFSLAGQEDALLDYLMHLRHRYSGASLTLAIVRERLRRNDRPGAEAYLLETLRLTPSLRSFKCALTLASEPARPVDELLIACLERLQREKPTYQCTMCGFPAHHLHWHCPSCRRWDTIRPIRGVDGE